MNSSMSGWWTLMTAMLAPSRLPPWVIIVETLERWRRTAMGPQALPWVDEMWAPFWRRLDRGTPVPPPNFCTMAMSDAVFMMADMLSSRGRTKQAERVPASVPAFIIVGELGRNSRRVIMR